MSKALILCVNILVQNKFKATFLQIYTTFPSQNGVCNHVLTRPYSERRLIIQKF